MDTWLECKRKCCQKEPRQRNKEVERKPRRSQPRWEDCLKRQIRKTEEDEEWEKDRRQRAMEEISSPVGVERCDKFV